MKKYFLRLSLALSALLAFSQAGAQVFYKIEGNNLKSPSYLFGSHHMAPSDFPDRFQSMPEAFKNTEAVVGEIDMTGNPMQLQMEMAQYMMAPEDSTLTKLVSPEEFAILSDQFRPLAPMQGLELSMLEGMRPMVPTAMATISLVQKSLPNFDPNNQLDATFQKKYKEAGKKIIPLETASQQAELLYCSTPILKQLDVLRETLSNPEEGEKMAKNLNEGYLSQNLDVLLQLMEEESGDKAFMDALLDKRNHNWMTQLPVIMSDQPVLIVVGAAHLAGKQGLINLLREAGYLVTPLK